MTVLEKYAAVVAAARKLDKAISTVHGLAQLTDEDAGLTVNAMWIELRNALKALDAPSPAEGKGVD